MKFIAIERTEYLKTYADEIDAGVLWSFTLNDVFTGAVELDDSRTYAAIYRNTEHATRKYYRIAELPD